jgi:hypothetical protein
VAELKCRLVRVKKLKKEKNLINLVKNKSWFFNPIWTWLQTINSFYILNQHFDSWSKAPVLQWLQLLTIRNIKNANFDDDGICLRLVRGQKECSRFMPGPLPSLEPSCNWWRKLVSFLHGSIWDSNKVSCWYNTETRMIVKDIMTSLRMLSKLN